MLENLRNKTGSILIWVIFAFIILSFVLFFGPQSEGTLGCGQTVDPAMDIDGYRVKDVNFRFAYSTTRANPAVKSETQRQANRISTALDRLLVRELLAIEAESLGFRLSEDTVLDRIANGDSYALLTPLLSYDRETNTESVPYFDEDGIYNERLLRQLASNLGLRSIDEFINQQYREISAQTALRLIRQTAVVSDEEIEAIYLQEANYATLDFAQFTPGSYRRIAVDESILDPFIAKHEAKLKKLWEERKDTPGMTTERDDIRVRQIFLSKDGEMKPGQDQAAAEAKVKARAEALQKQAAASPGAFADLAKKSSEDMYQSVGGDRWWTSKKSPNIGKPAVNEALKTLDKGAVSDVIETDKGFYILYVSDVRQTKLDSWELGKYEIAKSEYIADAARADAEATLAKILAVKPKDDSEDPLLDTLATDDNSERPKGGYNVNLPWLRTSQRLYRFSKESGINFPTSGAPEAIKDLVFSTLKPAAIHPNVVKIGDAYYILRLQSINKPDLAGLRGDDEELETLRSGFARWKSESLFRRWLERRCGEISSKVTVSSRYLRIQDKDDKTVQLSYKPCDTQLRDFAQQDVRQVAGGRSVLRSFVQQAITRMTAKQAALAPKEPEEDKPDAAGGADDAKSTEAKAKSSSETAKLPE